MKEIYAEFGCYDHIYYQPTKLKEFIDLMDTNSEEGEEDLDDIYEYDPHLKKI